MWIRTEPDRRPGAHAPLLLLALLVLGLALGTPPAAAQEAPTAEAAAPATPTAELAATLEERYRALPAREGVMLVPRDEIPGIQSLQITGGEVAVNGEVVSPTILRSWLGDEAEPLLALAALDDDEARALLTVEAAPQGGGAAAAAPADPAAQPDAEADPDADLPEPAEPPVAPEPPDAPPAPSIQLGQQFTMGNDIVIDEDEVATEAVAIGGSVLVRGRVRRDVVAIGGRVEVTGEVGGEIVSVLGGVALGPEADVGGNITSVGGGLRRAPGAEVRGQVTEVAIPYAGAGDFQWEDWVEHRDRPFVREWRVKEAYWNLVGAVLLALLVCLALLIGRGVVERVERRIGNLSDFLVAGLVGLGVMLLLGPVLLIVTVLLVLTIVGCLALPLIPFALLALLVAAVFGYAGVALRLGRWCEQRFGWKLAGPYVPALVGVALIEVWRLIGEGLDIFGGPAWFFAFMFIALGVVVEFVAWAVGLGAILMNMVDRRPLPPAGTPAPPPLPAGTGDAPAVGAGVAGSDAGGAAPAPPPVPEAGDPGGSPPQVPEAEPPGEGGGTRG